MRRHSALVVLAGVLVGMLGMAPASASSSVDILSPTGGYVPGSFTVLVAADDDDGVASVELLVDGISAGSVISEPFEFALTGSDDTTIQLVARMTDSLDNVTNSAPVTVTVDAVAPSLSITTPQGSTLLNLPTVNEFIGGDGVEGTSSDDGSGVVTIAVNLTHTTLNLSESGHASIADDGSWEYVPAFALVPGEYLVDATPVDAADNVGATATVVVTVV
ncbi:MAG TPA: Ig-like domain-containing protein [Actinomycetota bacterium]|nr:Ig-like domain-containing protein [Actinomycetota bacterium]